MARMENVHSKKRNLYGVFVVMKMVFRNLGLRALAAHATVGALVATGVTTAAERPNILLFLVDDMGLMDTSQPFFSGREWQANKDAIEYILPDTSDGESC